MKGIKILVVIVILLPMGYFASIFAASELGGEVVTLLRPNAEGGIDEVRVWVVDTPESVLIEHGSQGDWWLTQLPENPNISLVRGGQKLTFLATASTDFHQRYHELRAAKYGWADRTIEILTGSDAAVCDGMPVRLEIAK